MKAPFDSPGARLSALRGQYVLLLKQLFKYLNDQNNKAVRQLLSTQRALPKFQDGLLAYIDSPEAQTDISNLSPRAFFGLLEIAGDRKHIGAGAAIRILIQMSPRSKALGALRSEIEPYLLNSKTASIASVVLSVKARDKVRIIMSNKLFDRMFKSKFQKVRLAAVRLITCSGGMLHRNHKRLVRILCDRDVNVRRLFLRGVSHCPGLASTLVGEIEKAVRIARDAKVRKKMQRSLNLLKHASVENARHWEIALKDLDGLVVAAGPAVPAQVRREKAEGSSGCETRPGKGRPTG